MIEILWHGRGGQGAFTAAKLLGAAYVLDGDENYALAFPSFGPERRGAPIRAFTKLDNKKIGDRSEITKADYVIYLDDTLFDEKEAYSELKQGGKILLNTSKDVDDERVIRVNGDNIALEILKLPITNTIMLGALAQLYDGISLEAVVQAIKEYMPEKLHNKNIAAVEAAAKEVAG